MTGLCCRCFTLPASPEELWENYIHWIVEGWSEVARRDYPATVPSDANDRREINGVAWLVEHVRYIGYRPWVFGRYEDVRTKEKFLHFYTCDLLNHRTGMCSDYENRHDMCSIYIHCEHPSACDSLWCSCHPIGQLAKDYRNFMNPLVKERLPTQCLTTKPSKTH